MKDKLIELIKYGFWGGLTTCLNLFLFFVLDKLSIMHYLIANGIAYVIAVVVNYICNRVFVFNAPEQIVQGKEEITKQFIKFLVMRVISLVVDTALFFVVVDLMGVPKIPGRIALSAIIIMATFIFSKLFVFKATESPNTTPQSTDTDM